MDELVQHLKESGVLKTPRIIEAFKAIDRKHFVLPEYRGEAYGDYPLPLGYGQTISQPSTVAFMLELLQPKLNDQILDIGSGSSWTTALLAHIVGTGGSVIGVEIIEGLVELGIRNLKHYNFTHAHIEKAGPSLGLPSHEPFDRILVSASADKLPENLVPQVRIGGIIVIPVRDAILKVTRTATNHQEIETYKGFAFVPLI